jgi:hypothetical protein
LQKTIIIHTHKITRNISVYILRRVYLTNIDYNIKGKIYKIALQVQLFDVKQQDKSDLNKLRLFVRSNRPI